MRTAKDIKIGDIIKKQGLKLTVIKISNGEYKNGVKEIILECSSDNTTRIDSYIRYKENTKIN